MSRVHPENPTAEALVCEIHRHNTFPISPNWLLQDVNKKHKEQYFSSLVDGSFQDLEDFDWTLMPHKILLKLLGKLLPTQPRKLFKKTEQTVLVEGLKRALKERSTGFIAEIPVFIPLDPDEDKLADGPPHDSEDNSQSRLSDEDFKSLLRAEYNYLTRFQCQTYEDIRSSIDESDFPVDGTTIVRRKHRGRVTAIKTEVESPWKLSMIADGFDENTQADKQEEELDFATSQRHIKRIYDLFRDETFGELQKESEHEFHKRVKLVLLAYRMKSIFSVKNQFLEQLIPPADTPGSKLLLLKAFWEPKWSESFDNVQRRMHHWLIRYFESEQDSTAFNNLKALAEAECEAVSDEILPYNHLREYIRTSEHRDWFVKEFVSSGTCRWIYEALHDGNVTHLRVPIDDEKTRKKPCRLGLYTYYESHLQDRLPCHMPQRQKQEQYQANESPYRVMSTGYRFAFNPSSKCRDEQEYAWIFQAVEENRYVCKALYDVNPRGVYYPESNCLFHIPSGQAEENQVTAIHETFIPPQLLYHSVGDPHNANFRNYQPCSSLAIIWQLQTAEFNAFLFDPKHPITTEIPKAMVDDDNGRIVDRNIPEELYWTYNQKKVRFDVKDNNKEIRRLTDVLPKSVTDECEYPALVYKSLGLVEKCDFRTKKCFVSFLATAIAVAQKKAFDKDKNALLVGKRRVERHKGSIGDQVDQMIQQCTKAQKYAKWKRCLADLISTVVAVSEEHSRETLKECLGGKEIGQVVVDLADAIAEARYRHQKCYFGGSIDKHHMDPTVFMTDFQCGDGSEPQYP